MRMERCIKNFCGVSHFIFSDVSFLSSSLFSAPPGHDALLDLDQPVEAGERRLRVACQALRLLVDCPVVAFLGSDTVRWQWRWRCRLVLSISSACPRALVVKQSIGQVFRDDHKLFAVKGKITAKPFIDLLTQHTTRRELYSSGAADIMRRLLEKATGWTWNFNVFCGISYTVDEVIVVSLFLNQTCGTLRHETCWTIWRLQGGLKRCKYNFYFRDFAAKLSIL